MASEPLSSPYTQDLSPPSPYPPCTPSSYTCPVETRSDSIRRGSKESASPACLSIPTRVFIGRDLLTIEDLVGEGGFGIVFKASLRNANLGVAVKYFRPGASAATIAQEVEIWRRLSHRHIVQYYRSSTAGNNPALLVSELAENGNIETYLQHHPQANRAVLIHQIALGIEYLHAKNIIHGDLKPPNVLISATGDVRICDFGMSRIKQQTVTVSIIKPPPSVGDRKILGTPHYLAPEGWYGRIYRAGDSYAYAMTCLAIFTGAAPWGICDASTIRELVQQGERPMHPNEHELTAPGLTKEIWELIVSSWVQNPKERLTFAKIVERFRFIPEAHAPQHR